MDLLRCKKKVVLFTIYEKKKKVNHVTHEQAYTCLAKIKNKMDPA